MSDPSPADVMPTAATMEELDAIASSRAKGRLQIVTGEIIVNKTRVATAEKACHAAIVAQNPGCRLDAVAGTIYFNSRFRHRTNPRNYRNSSLSTLSTLVSLSLEKWRVMLTRRIGDSGSRRTMRDTTDQSVLSALSPTAPQ